MIERPEERGCGGGNRTRSLTAYEAAAFPPGSPAIGRMARRPGAAPGSRSFGDSAAQAGARHVVGDLKIGAVSRNCTGIA